MYTKQSYSSEHYQSFGYIQYLPKNFDENKKYPLVLFLHGAGERGDDLDLLAKHGYMKYHVEDGREYPFIFMSPQCPEDRYWGNYVESLHKFLDYICDILPVDQKSIYLTGISMGGTGTYLMAQAEPSRFAAIAPVCGSHFLIIHMTPQIRILALVYTILGNKKRGFPLFFYENVC